LRALALDDAGEGLSAAFDDIDALAERCHFRDCGHEAEPGCAVREARASGALDEDRWRSFVKLRKEIAYQASQEDPLLREQVRRKWVAIHKGARARYKAREHGG
ncbi:MAG TPA: ribosome small subunit-dependent GTPase A, partial [Caulobacteraceae bacterium]